MSSRGGSRAHEHVSGSIEHVASSLARSHLEDTYIRDMSFSRLLQNAPYYSPAAFSPERRRQEGPSELARARRAKAARPLVDPYATLDAPEFDSFVDTVSSRIVNALTYEPNRDRRIRRGYAQDEEYWMEMGGKPGEFVGNETTAGSTPMDEDDTPQEPAADATQAEVDADGSLDEVLDSIEMGYAPQMATSIPEEADMEVDIDPVSQPARPTTVDEPVLSRQASAPTYALQATIENAANPPEPVFDGIYPDLTTFRDDYSPEGQIAGLAANDIGIPTNSLYPSLSTLQDKTSPYVSENEAYQLDLLRQFTHEGYDSYTAPSQDVETSDMQSIEDLLSMAEKDAKGATEAIQRIREEDEIEQQLDEAFLEEVELVLSDQEMQDDTRESDEAVPSAEPEEEFDEESPLAEPATKERSASREVSDVISIGSTSDESEQEEVEEEAVDKGTGDIDDEEEEEEEEEDIDTAGVTPPLRSDYISYPEPSRELFGQLDLPVASQVRYMSQKLRRRMDEDDLRISGFDEEDDAAASGSSDASDEDAREWQRLRRKAGKGQRAQDEQDAADRYFDDEEDEEASRASDGEEEDESEDDESEQEGSAYRLTSKQRRNAEDEFEDELSDDAVADDERQAQRLKGDLDERVPIPAFMKRDKETGEYELRIGSSDEEDDQDEEEEIEELEGTAAIAGAEDADADDLKIEFLDDDQVEIQIEEEVEVTVQIETEINGVSPDSQAIEAVDDSLLADPMLDDTGSESIAEYIDLAKSEQSISPIQATSATVDQKADINQLLEASLSAAQPSLPNLSGMPPLPKSLADVADQLVADALGEAEDNLARTLQQSIDDAFSSTKEEVRASSTDSMEQDTGATSPHSRARRRSREPSSGASAKTPRKSEHKLFSSIAVSPEQFSLPRRATTPALSAEETALSEENALLAASASESLMDADTETEVEESKTSSNSRSSVSTADAMIEEADPLRSPNVVETVGMHHDGLKGPDMGSKTQPSPVFNEDHHHEPPPPELQEGEHFALPTPIRPVDEAMIGVDLTTDEMESHSVDGKGEGEQVGDTEFTEDHHFERPPPELQKPTEDRVGAELHSEFAPLTGIDMTTDEMEQHSSDEKAIEPLRKVGLIEEVSDEASPSSSESALEEMRVPTEAAAESQSVNFEVADIGEPEHVSSGGELQPAGSLTPPQKVQTSLPKLATEDSTGNALETKPSPAEPDNIVHPGDSQAVATPTRAFNVIQPGLWDPSTPIRFGGRSLEAAVREAYYDPDRSDNLQKTIGTDRPKSEDKARPEQSSSADTSRHSAGKKGHADFDGHEQGGKNEPAVDIDNHEAVGTETMVADDAVMTPDETRREEDDIPPRISSPGIKQADGSLTEAVQEGDFVGNTVKDVLAEDSELPRLEPEVLESAEDSHVSDPSPSTTPTGEHYSESPDTVDVEVAQASRMSASGDDAPATAESGSSSEESDDDDHQVAASLVRGRKLENKTPAKVRRGRSRTRKTPVTSRKGKERAEPEEELALDLASEDTEYLSSSSSEEEDLIRVTSKRIRSESVANDPEADTPRERAVTPVKDSQGRNIVTTVIVPGSPISPATPLEEMEVSAMLAPGPSKPRFHRHGASGSNNNMLNRQTDRRRRESHSSRSTTSRTSAEPVSGPAAPVHPDPEHQRSSHTSPGHGSSPIQTRSQCTYRKLMIPNPYLGSINTPGRRISTRLARAAGEATNEASQQEFPPSFIFLVPGCVTADRKEQMEEGGIVDLGVASVEEEGSAVALRNSEENETGLHVEGLPDSVVQSLVRVVGLEMFRDGDCEILSPLVQQSPGSPARNGNGTERKRRRESDMMSPPGAVKRLR